MFRVPLALYVYMDAMMKEMKIGMGKRGGRFQEEGKDKTALRGDEGRRRKDR